MFQVQEHVVGMVMVVLKNYRVFQWIGYFRFELNLLVLKLFLGRTSGGRRRVLVDISEGHLKVSR